MLYWFRDWEDDRRFAAFRQSYAGAFADLEKRYDDLSPVAREVFRLEAAKIRDRNAAESIDRLRGGFLVNAGSLELGMCRLISRAALTCMVREGVRAAGLSEMGFRVNVTTYPLFDRLVGLFGFLAVWYAAVVVLSNPSNWNVIEMVLLGVGIASLSCMAIFVALWLKRFDFARRSASGRPMRGYVLAAVVAMAASFLLTWGLHVMLTSSLVDGANRQGITWPWILVAGATAFLTSFLADDRWAGTGTPMFGSRAVEAAVFTTAGMVMVVVVRHLLVHNCAATVVLPSCGTDFVPGWLPLILGAGVGGAVIGWCVPTWFRESEVEGHAPSTPVGPEQAAEDVVPEPRGRVSARGR